MQLLEIAARQTALLWRQSCPVLQAGLHALLLCQGQFRITRSHAEQFVALHIREAIPFGRQRRQHLLLLQR